MTAPTTLSDDEFTWLLAHFADRAGVGVVLNSNGIDPAVVRLMAAELARLKAPVTEGEVADALRILTALWTDWNKSELPDAAEVMPNMNCWEARTIAATLRRLSAQSLKAKEEGRREMRESAAKVCLDHADSRAYQADGLEQAASAEARKNISVLQRCAEQAARLCEKAIRALPTGEPT